MVIRKIKTLAGSSKLLFQQNFDKASNASPFFAHYKAVVALVVLLLCSTIVVASLNHPDYLVPRSLLDHGVFTVGLVENVYVKTEPRGRGGKDYITTIDYRFTGPDGKIYRGTSSYKGDRPKPIAAGGSIEVVHDRYSPSTSAWRTALHGMEAGVYGSLFAAGLFIPWCILSLYRYARWSQRRRSSRADSSA